MSSEEGKNRLKELADYKILDTEPEEQFNKLVAMAAAICEVPIGKISFGDGNRRWVKACVGSDPLETPLDFSFCEAVTESRKQMIISDLSKDPRFANNPMVVDSSHFRFYAGFPLISNGHVLGTLCVIDTKPRTLKPVQIEFLQILASEVLSHLKLRRTLLELNGAQAAIAEENNRFNNLVNHLKEAVFQTDYEGHWTYLSPAWTEILGYSIEESLKKSFIDYLHPDDQLLTGFEPLLNGDVTFVRRQVRYLKKSGDYCPMEVSISVTYGKKGEILGLTGTLTDITQKLINEKIMEDQRLKMIHSGRLYSLGEMAAGIAHEINNPLAIIRGAAQVLQLSVKDNSVDVLSVKETAAKIDSTVSRISKIISGLRSFARDGGTDPFVSTSIKAVITEALELCQSRFRNHGIGLIVENTETDLHIQCRPVQISQAILNLLNNAFDAIEKLERKQIRIQLIEATEVIKINVYDSGKGIPEELLAKVMQPFFSTKGPNRGMGLGLSLSKGLIESHGGSLELSTVYGWTCFTITLPKKQASPSAVRIAS